MRLISKHVYFHVLFFLVCSIISPFSIIYAEETADIEPPPILQDIVNERDKKPNMRSVTWNTSKKEDQVSGEDSDEKTSSETESASSEDENLTPEQKLWNKYRDLADGKGKENAKDNDVNDEDVSADEETPNAIEETAEVEPKKKSGLQGILENYKNAQKDKGKMNSRSFGNPDR